MAGTWGLGLLLLILLFALGDRSHLTRLPELHWRGVFFVFLFNLGFTIAHNLRWKEIVDNLPPLRKRSFFSLYLSLIDSYAIGKIIPMDLSLLGIRSYYLHRVEEMPLPVAVFSVLMDRFMDIVVFLLMALPSFLLITGIASPIQSLSVLILLILGECLLLLWEKRRELSLSFFTLSGPPPAMGFENSISRESGEKRD